MGLKEKEFVDAARALGQRHRVILSRHILPNIGGELVVLGSLWTASAIRLEASLSFIGLGAQLPKPEWGAMLSQGRSYLPAQWWIATFPGIVVVLCVLLLSGRLGTDEH